MDLKTAYQLLGLPEDATREAVDKRYDVLLRQERRRQREAAGTDAEQNDAFTEVNRAYRYILEHEGQQAIEEMEEAQYGKYKRFAGTAKRLDHWYSYYKWHTIGVIAAIGLIIYGIVSFVDYREEQARLAALPPVDLDGTIIGQFFMPDTSTSTDAVEAALLEQMPDWKRVELTYLALSMDVRSEMDIAMQQKAFVMLATERPDIYLMDEQTYAWVARAGVLKPLDVEVAGRFNGLIPDGGAIPTYGDNESDEQRVYGIDLTDTYLIQQLPLIGDRFIVGIRVDAERPDKALDFIETYLKRQP